MDGLWSLYSEVGFNLVYKPMVASEQLPLLPCSSCEQCRNQADMCFLNLVIVVFSHNCSRVGKCTHKLIIGMHNGVDSASHQVWMLNASQHSKSSQNQILVFADHLHRHRNHKKFMPPFAYYCSVHRIYLRRSTCFKAALRCWCAIVRNCCVYSASACPVSEEASCVEVKYGRRSRVGL